MEYDVHGETPMRVVGDSAHHEDFDEEVDGDLAVDWMEWSAKIGEATVPFLEQLNALIPDLKSVMLCTADGFNLCSMGVDEGAVGRLAALSSSLFTVSNAAAGAVNGFRARSETTLDLVSLVSGGSQVIVTAIEHDTFGHLLLWCAADDTSMGVMVVGIRQTAEKIRAMLADPEGTQA